MNTRDRAIILLRLLITCAASIFIGTTSHATFSLSSYLPRPTDEVLETWVDHEPAGEQIWGFESRADFESLLDHSKLPEVIRAQLRALLVDEAPTYDFERDDPDLQADSGPSVQAHLRVNEDLWRKLSPEFRNAIYSFFSRPGGRPGLIFELPTTGPLTNANEFGEWLLGLVETIAKTSAGEGVLIESVVKSRAGWALPVTPFVWRHLNREARRHLIREHLLDNPCARGLRCRLDVTPSNLEDHVREFGGASAAKVRAKLMHALVAAGGQRASVDLAAILPRFMRTHLGQFARCSGLSCLATGLNADREGAFLPGPVNTATLERHLENEYRALSPAEPSRLGDLMVFVKRDGPGPIHVATFVTDDLVFTKNGMSRYHPYVLQKTRDNIAIYFPDGEYRQFNFRRLCQDELGQEPKAP